MGSARTRILARTLTHPPRSPLLSRAQLAQYVSAVGAELRAALSPADASRLAGWDLRVIQSAEANAFALPGGRVFVYSGMLDVATSRAQLAAVLGHEIAHAVGRHSAEKMGFAAVAAGIAHVLTPYEHRRRWAYSSGAPIDAGDVAYNLAATLAALAATLALQVVVGLAYSRALESEADRVGQRLMARAGYDPAEAKVVWQTFEDAERRARGPGDMLARAFFSTHPSHAQRIADLARWEADCAADYAAARSARFERGMLEEQWSGFDPAAAGDDDDAKWRGFEPAGDDEGNWKGFDPAPLPEGWEAAPQSFRGRRYWRSSLTGQVSLHHPRRLARAAASAPMTAAAASAVVERAEASPTLLSRLRSRFVRSNPPPAQVADSETPTRRLRPTAPPAAPAVERAEDPTRRSLEVEQRRRARVRAAFVGLWSRLVGSRTGAAPAAAPQPLQLLTAAEVAQQRSAFEAAHTHNERGALARMSKWARFWEWADPGYSDPARLQRSNEIAGLASSLAVGAWASTARKPISGV